MARVAPAGPAVAAVNDANVQESLRSAQDQLNKGKIDEALRMLQAVHSYAVDNLQLMACVGEAYEKARNNDQALSQDQKETLYLRQQRMGGLVAAYTKVRGESAYNLGLAYVKKGDAPQARKYLVEACRTAPFSMDPASLWMRSKDLFLKISGLEGEF